MASIQSTLTDLRSADNAVRASAEDIFESALQDHTADVAHGLLTCLCAAQAGSDVERNFAAVLLRRVVQPAGTYWGKLTTQTQTTVREALLSAFQQEVSPLVARTISHAIAQGAAGTQDGQTWPGLLQTVIGYTQTVADPARKIAALFLLDQVQEVCTKAAQEQAQPLMQMYAAALVDLGELAVAVAAFKAAAGLLAVLDNDQQRAQYVEVLPLMLKVLHAVLTKGQESEAAELLACLEELASTGAMFFKPYLNDVCGAMLTVGYAEQLEFQTRADAVEVLLSLSGAVPALMRKCSSFTGPQGLLPLTMQIMCQVDDDLDAWCSGPYGEDLDAEEEGQLGVQALTRLLEALMARTTLPLAVQIVPQWLCSPDWRKRRAALCTLTCLADGLHKAFRPHLPAAVAAAMQCVRDPNVRVRYQSLDLLARLCDQYPDAVQSAYHQQVIPALCSFLEDPSAPLRIRGHAASALVNFTQPEKCPLEAIAPHTDCLLQALCCCLQNTSGEVQHAALSAVAVIAQRTQADFSRYYDAFMPGIQSIVAAATATDKGGERGLKLLGQALHCAGMVGEAVGKDKFGPDALQLMHALMGRMQAAGAPDQGGEAVRQEFVLEHMAPACASICKAIGADFLQFMPVVLPPLFKALEAQVEFSMVDADDEEEGQVTQDEEKSTTSLVLTVKGLGAKRVTLNTFSVSCKNTAARLLFEYADILGEHYLEHVQATASALLPMITFPYNEEVRSASALALGRVFACAMKALEEGLATDLKALLGLLEACTEKLMQALASERIPEAQSCMSSALRDMLRLCQESGGEDHSTGQPKPPRVQVSLERAGEMTRHLRTLAAQTAERILETVNQFGGGGARDEEDRDALNSALEEDEDVLENLVDSMGYLLKGHGPLFLPVFEEAVAPLFGALLDPQCPATLRRSAVCAFDDAVEHCGPGAHKYLPLCFPAFVQGMAEDHAMLQMAAVFGVLQTIKQAPTFFKPVCQQVLPKLMELAAPPRTSEQQEEEDEDRRFVAENAVSAIGAVCLSPVLRDSVERGPLLSLWLSQLPLRQDESEARTVHRQLCDMLEQADSALLGPGLANLPQILRVLAQLLETWSQADRPGEEPCALIDGTTQGRIVAVLRGIRSQVPPSHLQASWSTLTESQQKSVQRELASLD